MTNEIIMQSATLRGQRKFDESIELIESNIDSIEKESKVVAWLEAFRAAKESGDMIKTKKYAKLVANEDPEIPSIQSYL